MRHPFFSEDFSPIQVANDPVEVLQGHRQEVLKALFSDDGMFIVSTDGKEIRVWKRNEQNKYLIHRVIETATKSFSLTSDGRFIASVEQHSVWKNTVHLWSADGERITTVLPHG